MCVSGTKDHTDVLKLLFTLLHRHRIPILRKNKSIKQLYGRKNTENEKELRRTKIITSKFYQTLIIGSLTSPLPRRRCECQPCIARAAASLRALPDAEAWIHSSLEMIVRQKISIVLTVIRCSFVRLSLSYKNKIIRVSYIFNYKFQQDL